MTFLNAIADGLRNTANFSGRATRSEFWYWTLGYTLVMLPLVVADEIYNPGEQLGKLSAVVGLMTLALALPNLAIAVRRLHDTDRSGWWVMLGATVIGIPVLIYWYCCHGSEGGNRFDGAQTIAKPRFKAPAVMDVAVRA